MPTLNSQVAVTVTAPSATQYLGGGQANHLDYVYANGLLRLLGSPWHFNALAQEFTQKYWINGHVFGSEGIDFEANPHASELLLVIGSNPWMSHGFQRARVVLKEIAKKAGAAAESLLRLNDPKGVYSHCFCDVDM